jgi:hypothetical protein
MGMRQALPIETKPFFLTSEFWGSIALIVGLAIAAGTSDDIDARLFWILATAVTAAYVISRGIAKSGTKSRSWDPRDDLMEGARDRMSSRGRTARATRSAPRRGPPSLSSPLGGWRRPGLRALAR